MTMAPRRLGKQQSDRLPPAVISHLRRQVPRRSSLDAHLLDLYLPHRRQTVVPMEQVAGGWRCVTSPLQHGPRKNCQITDLEAATAVERPGSARYMDDLSPADQLFVWQTHGWITWPGGPSARLITPLARLTDPETMTITLSEAVLGSLRRQLASRSTKTVHHMVASMVDAHYLVARPFPGGAADEYHLVLPADRWKL